MSLSTNLFFVFVLFIQISSFTCYNFISNNPLINLTPYTYPKRQGNLKDNYYQIAIMGTNDLHGYIFPEKFEHPTSHLKYSSKGLKYLAGYANILKRAWGKRFLWLDAGNQFQGGLESKVSQGKAMNQFFYIAGLDAATIGNHDWEYSAEFLKEYTKRSNKPFVVSNMYNTKLKSNISLANQYDSFILLAGKIKVGVIGITDMNTKQESKTDLSEYEFYDYKDIVISKAKELREQHAVNVVVLLSNPSMKCTNPPTDNKVLKLNKLSTSNNICNYEGELYTLLASLPQGTVDVVISSAGSSNALNHHFYNGIPIISANKNGENMNIVYLSFDKRTLQFIPSETSIEGPVPICDKVFSNTNTCDELSSIDDAVNAGQLVDFTFHSRTLDVDRRVDAIIEPYREQLMEYENTVVTTIPEEMAINYRKENFLGNVLSDFLIKTTNASISVINSGSARSVWSAGKINVLDVLKMFPFYDNFIVTFEMSGWELKRMIKQIQFGDVKEGLYQCSGVVTYFDKSNKVINVTLPNGNEINDDDTFTIASNDFCMPGYGDDFDKVKMFYKVKNLHYVKNFNDALIEYLKGFKHGLKKEEFYNEHALRFLFEQEHF